MPQLVAVSNALLFAPLFLGRKARVHAAIEHGDFVGRSVVQLDHVVLGGLRVGQHVLAGPHRAGNHRAEVAAQAGRGRIGVADEREVMHGEQRARARQGGGQDKVGGVKKVLPPNQGLYRQGQARALPQAGQPGVRERGRLDAKVGRAHEYPVAARQHEHHAHTAPGAGDVQRPGALGGGVVGGAGNHHHVGGDLLQGLQLLAAATGLYLIAAPFQLLLGASFCFAALAREQNALAPPHVTHRRAPLGYKERVLIFVVYGGQGAHQLAHIATNAGALLYGGGIVNSNAH